MHRVADPKHRPARVPDRPDERGQRLPDRPGPHPRDEGQPAGLALGVEALAERQHLGGGRPRAELARDGVLHARKELDVSAAGLAGPLPCPQQVGGAVVEVPRQAVLAGEGLLEAEDEGLVARVEVHLVQGHVRGQVDAAGGHEAQGAVDGAGDVLVAPSLRAGGNELLVPHVDLVEVGKPALGEGPEEVERRRRLVVRPQEPLGIGPPGDRVEVDVVDHVAPERGQLQPVDQLAGRGAGLGELPGDPAHLDDWQPRRVGQHHRDLQDDLELVADRVGGEVVERLGALSRLQYKRFAPGSCSEGRLQCPRLPCKYEGRLVPQLLQGEVQRAGIVPVRLLGGGQLPPRFGRPGSCHGLYGRVSGTDLPFQAMTDSAPRACGARPGRPPARTRRTTGPAPGDPEASPPAGAP